MALLTPQWGNIEQAPSNPAQILRWGERRTNTVRGDFRLDLLKRKPAFPPLGGQGAIQMTNFSQLHTFQTASKPCGPCLQRLTGSRMRPASWINYFLGLAYVIA